MPLDEVLPIAKQIADALEAGHEDAPTITTPAHLRPGYGGPAVTQAGMIVGTAAYMSPEQAKGRVVDKRSDLWDDKDTAHVPESWAPDGKTLLFSVAKGSSYSLAALSLPDKKVMPFGGVPSTTPPAATFSPDGKWVAYSVGGRSERRADVTSSIRRSTASATTGSSA